jgi:hypothetical protein
MAIVQQNKDDEMVMDVEEEEEKVQRDYNRKKFEESKMPTNHSVVRE